MRVVILQPARGEESGIALIRLFIIFLSEGATELTRFSRAFAFRASLPKLSSKARASTNFSPTGHFHPLFLTRELYFD